MLAGTLLFSFSIYLLNLNKYIEIPLFILGPTTPFGGMLLITSWIFLFFSIKKVN
jgi:uncharacterized membrane protein YgdD (TMEM256/DUF423 family)